MTERSAFIIGLYRLDEGLAILLDIDRVLLLDAYQSDARREEEG
jgi:hypothetical protein